MVSWPLTIVKAVLSVSPAPETSEYAKVSSASMSEEESVPTTVPIVEFSATAAAEIAMSVGVSLTLVIARL